MRAYIAFVKKEFVESVRTYRLLILLAVFLLFGMLNPIMAKIMPDILSSVMLEGMTIEIAEPSALDSWTQFYKNMTGMQMIVFFISFSGIMAAEFSKGTLINVLTKGLPRRTVILSKFTAVSVIWTFCYALCLGVTYGYTCYLLPGGGLSNLIFAAFSLWFFGIVLISVMILGSVLFRSIYGALMFTGGFTVILMFLNMIPKLQKYNPYWLASGNIDLITSQLTISEFRYAIVSACVFTAVFLCGTLILFDRKQM